MINRYSRKEIKKIWDEENKFQIWLDIEIAAAEAMEKLKLIPKGVSSKIKRKAKINIERINKIEAKVHHDVIAFLTSITEKVGPEARYLHQGMTSSDILDTCFNILLIQSSKIIKQEIDEIIETLELNNETERSILDEEKKLHELSGKTYAERMRAKQIKENDFWEVK